MRLDPALTQGQMKSLFDYLAVKKETWNEPLVEVSYLLKMLISDNPYATVALRRDIGKRVSDYIESRPEVYKILKSKLENEDVEHDGHITPERLVVALQSIKALLP